ncbi:MAG: helix-hairpin-helix domain-containing protein [Thermoleophilia bacterium]|nr:helix-hairpin-helix domain-containing protein [Thermoleophilia bacterium]
MVVAQSTAEDRFARKLAERERDLERERDEKVSAIEDSDRRLLQIEQGTIAATERLETAERVLADEAKRLKLETAAHLEAASGRAREEAQIEADRRVAEREAELDAAKAEAKSLAREAEQRARAAELRARKAEEVGARTATDARVAAAEWLRGQADALRSEGERRSRAGLERPEDATERVERTSPPARNPPHRSREERFRAAAERLGRVAQQADDIRPLPTRRKPERDESTAARAAHGETVTLASANFEQLRHLGLSVTQAKRLLRHRDERGLSSVEDLVGVPGFTRSFLDELESRLVD